MNNFVQVKCSPESPLKSQIILDEVISFRHVVVRSGLIIRIHIRSKNIPWKRRGFIFLQPSRIIIFVHLMSQAPKFDGRSPPNTDPTIWHVENLIEYFSLDQSLGLRIF